MLKAELTACHRLISPYVHNTPVLSSRLVDKRAGAEVFFKCENFQRMGAYKMRGATHAIMRLSKAQQSRGVVTHSSGNFAQALSLAAQSIGVPAYIVMPNNAPQVKKDAVREYRGQIIECEATLEARAATAKDIERSKGATFVHPSNAMDVILGQGTAAMELLQSQPDLEYIICPVGGGGLVAGTALAAYNFGKGCKVIGGEPFAVDDAYRSLQSGVIESNATTDTVADGLKTQLGDKNFPIIQKYVDRIIRVTEEEIISAMRFIWERMKLVVEPSSAVALAALLREKAAFRDKKVGIIISGGNVDLAKLPF